MTKLQIIRRADASKEGFRSSDYHILLNGVDVGGTLTEVKLNIASGSFNECSLTFYPSEVDVDADVIGALETHIEPQEE